MKKNFLVLFLISLVLSLQGCSIRNAYNMTQCKYDYRSISSLSLAGIDLSKGVGVATGAKLLAVFNGNRSSIPLNFTINLNVTNPNQATAALQGLDYILKIDNVEFTRGSLDQSLHIPSGKTQLLPVTIGLDIATLLSGSSGKAAENIVKNFIGIGSEKSNVTLQLKPYFRMGGKSIPAPQYIPVSFAFGGK